jgi:hypothetical protein
MKRVVLFLFIFGGCMLGIGNGRFTQAAPQAETPFLIHLPLIIRTAFPPEIRHFTANTDLTDPGETIELSWKTAHATEITLYHMLPTGQFGTMWSVAAADVMQYTIPESTRNFERFILFASNKTFGWVSADVMIILNCPHSWFFTNHPDICAQDTAISSPGAEQAFEFGTMIWVKEEDRIYVLYDDENYTTRWDIFTDDWDKSDPIDDPSIVPPPGFYQPIRGFGLVWRDQPMVRDRLGWALAGEAGFITAVQRTSYAKYNDIYLQALDGKIWRLLPEHSGWEKIEPNK